MITFNEDATSYDPVVYQNHPEGKFEGIIYMFKNGGPKTNKYGKTSDQIQLRIEMESGSDADGKPIDKMMEPFTMTVDGTEETVHLPHSAPIFFNKVGGFFGGANVPKLQELRAEIMERSLTKAEWYNFNPETEWLALRVRYRVSHAPRGDGADDGVWVNTDIIERSSNNDREDVLESLQRDIVYLPDAPEDVDAPSDGGGMKIASSSATAPPSRPAPPAKKASEPTAFLNVLALLNKAEVITADDFKVWTEWATGSIDNEALEAEYRNFLTLAKNNNVTISTGDDDLPF
jgi:hypothetical protein